MNYKSINNISLEPAMNLPLETTDSSSSDTIGETPGQTRNKLIHPIETDAVKDTTNNATPNYLNEFQQGRIPEEYFEKHRLIPFESEEGQAFHQFMLNFTQKLYSNYRQECGKKNLQMNSFLNHDFSKYPVRFMLSKLKTPNAWYITMSNPPIIVITEELLTKTVKTNHKEELIVSCQEDLAYLLGHELTHMKIRSHYGNIQNTKLEEAAADWLPLELLRCTPECNPELAIHSIEKRIQLSTGFYIDSISQAVDPHPCDENLLSIVNTGLAYMRREYGELVPENYHGPTGISEIQQIISKSKHNSYLEGKLNEIHNYQSLSDEEKLTVLLTISKELENFHTVRIDDICKEISSLKLSEKTEKKIIDEFANFAFSLMEKYKIPSGKKLYLHLAEAVKNFDTPALGKLRPIYRAVDNFVKCSLTADEKQIKNAAKNLCSVFNTITSKLHANEKDFLHLVDWPQFPFPDTERVSKKIKKTALPGEEDRRPQDDYDLDKPKSIYDDDYYSNDYDENNRYSGEEDDDDDYSGSYGINSPRYNEIDYEDDSDDSDDNDNEEKEDDGEILISWFKLYDLVKTNKEVFKAAWIMGLGMDNNIQAAAKYHPDEAIEFYAENPNHQLTEGPTDNIGNKISTLTINEVGEIIDFKDDDKNKKINSDNWFQIKLNNLAYIANKLMFDEKSDEQTKQKLEKITNIMCSAKREAPLVGLDRCEENLPLFLEINSFSLSENNKYSLQLINKFKSLLKSNPEKAKKVIAEFYQYSNKEITPSGLIIMSFSKSFDESFSNTSLGKSFLSILNNPYLQLLINLPEEIIPKEDKFKILDINFSNMFPLYDADNVGIKQFITRCCSGFSLPWLIENPTWDQIIEFLKTEKEDLSIQEKGFRNLNLKQTYLFDQSFISLTRAKNPNYSQLKSFISLLPKVYPLNKLEKIRFNKLIDELILTRLHNGTNNIDEILSDWELLTQKGLLEDSQNDKCLETFIKKIQQTSTPNEQIRLLERILKDNTIKSCVLRQQYIDTWCNTIFTIYGKDDGSENYLQNLKEVISGLSKKINRLYHTELLDQLSKKTEAQKGMCEEIKSLLYNVDKKDINKILFGGIVSDAFLFAIKKDKYYGQETLRFLMMPFAEGNSEYSSIIKPLFKFADEYDEEKIDLKRYETIKYLHENFWAVPMEIRSVLAREILIDPENSNEEIPDNLFDFAINLTFNKKSEYYDETVKHIKAYIQALPSYQKHLALSAIMVASQKSQGKEIPIGESLAIFLENMGPAETKIGQVGESHPNVPLDIKADLKRLKYKADEPYRWNLIDLIEPISNEIEKIYNKYLNSANNQTNSVGIKRIGKVKGSASIFIAVEIEFTNGDKQVLALLRPYAMEKGQSGFKTFNKMIDNLGDNYHTVNTLQDLIENAHNKLEIETNCLIAPLQYGQAGQIYNNSSIEVNGEQFNFSAPEVTAAGNNFFLMQNMEGIHFLELPEKNETQIENKKNYAMAILSFSLNNILSGKFDNDRHGGNIKIDGNNINHIDFKAMSLNTWEQEGYDQFVEILLQVFTKIKSPEKFIETFLEQEKLIRDNGENIEPFVVEAQKALLSLGEYISCLSKQELIIAVLSSLKADIAPAMQASIIKKCPEGFKVIMKEFFETKKIPKILENLGVTDENLFKIKRGQND